MPQYYYELHAKETVHAVYALNAKTEEEARSRYENGDLPKPLVYEALDTEIDRIIVRSLDDQ